VIAATAELSRGAATGSAAAAKAAEVRSHPEPAQDSRRLAVAARIACLLLRPSDFVDESRLRIGAFVPAQIKRMVAHPGFRAPVNRVLATALGFDDAQIDADAVARWSSSARLRLAVLIVTEPIEVVTRAAAAMAAAVLSRRVLRLVLKSDRQRLRELLGDEFQIATHQAPLLHQVLGELDLGSADAGVLAHEGAAPDERRAQFVAFGHCALGRFLDASEPVFAELFAQRLPASAGYEQRANWIAPPEATHCDHVVKLLRRRQESWAAIIG
jgi:hypothetical protein